MALNATRLDEYTLAYNRSNLDAWEHRLSNYGVLATYQKDTPNLIPGYAELVANRPQELRTVRIPVINRKDVTTASSRTCSAIAHEITSTYVTPSWTTIKAGFNMRPAEYSLNHLAYQDAFNNKMTALQRTLAATLDTAGYTNINANNTLVYAADGNPYTLNGNLLDVPAADNDLFVNEVGPIMLQDDYPGDGLNFITSPRFRAMLSEYGNQGAYNAENRSFQFAGHSFAFSNRVAVATGYRDTVFVAPPGSLAFLTAVDPDSRLGHSSSDGKQWSTMVLPLLGIEAGVMYQSTCADVATSGATIGTGFEATLSESWMFSFDYSFNVAYNSITGTYAGPVHQFGLSST